MPSLIGFSNPLNQVPGFLIPIFIEHPFNHVLIQNISHDDKVTAFSQIDLPIDFNAENAEVSFLSVGDSALWAFAFEKNYILSGPSKQLAISLRNRLRKGLFKRLPFLENEVAFFCDDKVSYKRNLSKCFENLRRISPVAATVWRDNVILLPVAKKELSNLTPAMRNPALLSAVRARTSKSVRRIEVPSQLSGADERIYLPRTFELAKHLELDAVHVTQSQLGAKEDFKEPYAVLHGLNGIGRMVERKSPSHFHQEETIWSLPWVHGSSLKGIASGKFPTFTFVVLSLDDNQLDRAISLAKRHEDTIYVAIYLPPLSFKNRKGSSNFAFENELKKYFDYVFVIGNHILLEPDSSASRLAASSRAIKFVRACIESLIYAAWTTETVGNPKQFKKLFPTNGFCVVGRANREGSDHGPTNVIDRCFATMQSEQLQLRRSRRFLAVGASSIVYSEAMDEAAFENIRLGKDEIMRFEHEAGRGREAITTVAFGMEPSRMDRRRFPDFCLALLKSLGWSVVDTRGTEGAECMFSDYRLSFGFLVREDFDNNLFDRLLKRQRRTHVLTNFPPLPKMRTSKNSPVNFAHYSTLESFTNRVARTRK